MTTDGDKSPVLKKIDENFQSFLQDDNYKRGTQQIDKRALHNEFERVQENYAAFINFHFYRRHMKALKVRRGELSPDTENILVERGHQALKAYNGMSDALKRISEMLQSSGLAEAINRHAQAVFQYLEYNPKTPAIIERFREMGIPDRSIYCVVDQIVGMKYDALRVQGLNGTFSDLVDRVVSLAPRIENSIQVMRDHGLPMIEGGDSGNTDEYIEAGTAVGVAIGVGLLFGFCYDWRPMFLPAVHHWNS